MTAVSSFKPFADSPEVAENQLQAKQTWDAVFDTIAYVVPAREERLASPKTLFLISHEDWPSIRNLVQVATIFPGWTCLINSDIQVSPSLRPVEDKLVSLQARCAMSRRWEIESNKVVDLGLDWFAADQGIWQQILPKVPPYFRIGHILWDTWMLAMFMEVTKGRCYDVTGTRIIRHPKHGDRNMPHNDKIHQPEDGVIDRMHWPRYRLP